MNTMNAFFSGTDDANENNTQFYGVWGKVENKQPQFAFRYVVGDTKEECDPSMLIEWPQVKTETTTYSSQTISILNNDGEFIQGLGDETEITTQSEPEITEVKTVNYMGPWNLPEYPEDWMAQHSKKTYRAGGNYQYGRGYGNYSKYQQTSLLNDEGTEGDIWGNPYYPSEAGTKTNYASGGRNAGNFTSGVNNLFTPTFDVLSVYGREIPEETEELIHGFTKEMVITGEDFFDLYVD